MKGNEFGEFLKSLRLSRGLSLTKLSNLSGVSHPYLSQLETGKRGIPSPEILKKLADPLDIPYIQLYEKAGHLPKDKVYMSPEASAGLARLVAQRTAHISHDFSNLEDILESEELVYKNKLLTATDRQRILDMLILLFPNRNR